MLTASSTLPEVGIPCGRYAPSPTGALHAGNLRTALFTWLQARLSGGRYIIRVDDLDTSRNVAGAVQQIVADLKWLGLGVEDSDLDENGLAIYIQSERLMHYQHAFETLQRQKLIFPCNCSRKDIATAAAPPGPGKPASIYPGTCRPGNNHKTIEPSVASWRFLVCDLEVSFVDDILGQQHSNLAVESGDFVVKRKDGIFAYQLASVVDDILLGVTDVVRGADLMNSTARQIVLFRALGVTEPRFWHVPLMQDDQGNKLSKRDGSDSLVAWKQQGMSAQLVIGTLAASSGLIDAPIPVSARELLSHTSLESIRSL